uniref:Uncharacterized protein n=1 Tax=Eubacterium cellulosolvens (strain ATCC 43171 / JCM 9499 / 6) TaxID=633697 RepID=I5AWP3_EUBC6
MKEWSSPQLLAIDIADTRNSRHHFNYPDGVINGHQPKAKVEPTEVYGEPDVDRLS